MNTDYNTAGLAIESMKLTALQVLEDFPTGFSSEPLTSALNVDAYQYFTQDPDLSACGFDVHQIQPAPGKSQSTGQTLPGTFTSAISRTYPNCPRAYYEY